MDIIRTFAAFLEFCYIAHQNVITDDSLKKLTAALHRFHQYRVTFSGTVRADGLAGFSLPRQHSLVHYHDNIKNFGAPNGLCSSITESKHIAAVKRPWRRSSRYKALAQILKVNERLDRLAAARADFALRGMLTDSPLVASILNTTSNSNHDNNDGDGDSDRSDNEDIDDDEGDNDAGPVESEPLMNEVRLARDKGMYNSCDTSTSSHKLFNQLPPANTHQHSRPLESRSTSTIYPISSGNSSFINFIPTPTSNPMTFVLISAQCYGTQESLYSTPPLQHSVPPVTHPGQEECTGRLSAPHRGGQKVTSQAREEIVFSPMEGNLTPLECKASSWLVFTCSSSSRLPIRSIHVLLCTGTPRLGQSPMSPLDYGLWNRSTPTATIPAEM